MEKTKLHLKNCSKTYTTGNQSIPVLKDVSLDVYEDEFLIILGESGCGKTTLLNILGGIDRMDGSSDSEFSFEDINLVSASEQELTAYRRHHLGYIFQESRLMPNLTALENVQLMASLSANPIDPLEALSLVGLSDRAGHFPSELSLGQRQRVSIARAIAKAPDIIIADEPTSSLDPDTGRSVLELLSELCKSRRTPVVMTTHDVEFRKYADRILTLKDGKL